MDDYLTRYEAVVAQVERYCPSCHILVRNTRCPVCDKRWLDEPKAGDYCYLTEKDSARAGVLEDCLQQNSILYLTQNTLGAGVTSKIGSMFETVKFYVRYAYYQQANELVEELFTARPMENNLEDEALEQSSL